MAQAKTENLGTVVGRVGAGLTTLGGGDQMAHSMNHYGKRPPASLIGFPMIGASLPVPSGPGLLRSNKMRAHPSSGGMGQKTFYGKMGTDTE
jgi:hypothetical protein